MKKKVDDDVIHVAEISQGQFECCLLGRTPLIFNRMSEKAKRELLFPSGKKSAIERAVSLKHDPVGEYRASVHRFGDDSLPQYLGLPSTAFKKAIMTAALDLPGTRKAVIGRLTYVEGAYVLVGGTPELLMSTVRMPDMNRTPDIRTRAILPRWACRVSVTYTKPLLTGQAVANLLAAAGMTVGVGDWRLEKGAGNFGLFRVCNADDPEFLEVMAQGREVQKAALAATSPVCFDEESAELLDWYNTEILRRQQRGAASVTSVRRSRVLQESDVLEPTAPV